MVESVSIQQFVNEIPQNPQQSPKFPKIRGKSVEWVDKWENGSNLHHIVQFSEEIIKNNNPSTEDRNKILNLVAVCEEKTKEKINNLHGIAYVVEVFKSFFGQGKIGGVKEAEQLREQIRKSEQMDAAIEQLKQNPDVLQVNEGKDADEKFATALKHNKNAREWISKLSGNYVYTLVAQTSKKNDQVKLMLFIFKPKLTNDGEIGSGIINTREKSFPLSSYQHDKDYWQNLISSDNNLKGYGSKFAISQKPENYVHLVVKDNNSLEIDSPS